MLPDSVSIPFWRGEYLRTNLTYLSVPVMEELDKLLKRIINQYDCTSR